MHDAHMAKLQYIFDKALEHAEHCVENESPHTAGEWIDIAMDADHIMHSHNEADGSMSARTR